MRALAVDRVASWLPELGWRDWLASPEVGRPVAVFGRNAGDGRVELTAVLDHGVDGLAVVATRVAAGVPQPSLAAAAPGLAGFEREIHEQCGIAYVGHPWLKPVRAQGADSAAAMDAYPYYAVEGKPVHEVAVGPVHAGVIEPGSFRFQCHGERVLHLEIQLGYQHRGVERLLLAKAPGGLERAVPLVETVAGDSSVAHAIAFCLALEAQEPVSAEVALSRGILLELERVGIHLAGLSGMAADIAHLQAAAGYGRLRTVVINASMRLCGSRFGRGGVRPGACGYALDAEGRAGLANAIATLKHDLPAIDERFFGDLAVRRRFVGVGVLDMKRATEIGMVGLCARASGVRVDQRIGGIYEQFPLPSTTAATGDCWAREWLRMREIHESLAWLARVLEGQPGWARGPRTAFSPGRSRLCVGVAEGCRGEVVYALETDAAGDVVQVKVQDPSFRNWMGLQVAVRDNEIADFPICNKSFDLSYCGHDL